MIIKSSKVIFITKFFFRLIIKKNKNKFNSKHVAYLKSLLSIIINPTFKFLLVAIISISLPCKHKMETFAPVEFYDLTTATIWEMGETVDREAPTSHLCSMG